MKAFLDTSVLVAAFHTSHSHHQPSFDLLKRFSKNEVGCAAHSLAELYATLTGTPAPQRAGPDHVMLFVEDLRHRLSVIALNEREYLHALSTSAAASLSGGAIYDSLLGHCALKAGAQAIYTWNLKDFLRLPAPIPARVKTPAPLAVRG